MSKDLSFLYMEDDVLSGKIMKLLLAGLGYTVTIFTESSNFLEKVASLPKVPDVVFLDIHMEPHTGFEMLEMLRRHEQYEWCKVVALTASVMNEEVSLLKSAGFDGVIPKPIDQEAFPELLARILRGEKVWRVK
ncbi:MAG: response regulator [Chloroflexi bacterium]|nr:response regulator [Chloroflexota bacterium]